MQNTGADLYTNTATAKDTESFHPLDNNGERHSEQMKALHLISSDLKKQREETYTLRGQSIQRAS